MSLALSVETFSSQDVGAQRNELGWLGREWRVSWQDASELEDEAGPGGNSGSEQRAGV